MLHFYQIVATIPFRLMFPAKIINKKKIPKGPCILIYNHTSNLDSVLMAMYTWEKKFYLAKKELFSNPISSAFYKSIGLVKIDRESNDIKAIKNCLNLLKKGKKLCICPEGTRNHNENMEMGEFKNGVAMFACKAKVPIVPAFITTTPKIFKKTKIVVGDSFTLEEFYGKKLDKETLASAGEIVTDKMSEIRNIALNSLTKKK